MRATTSDLAIIQVRGQLERARPRLRFAREQAMRAMERRSPQTGGLQLAYFQTRAMVQALSGVLGDLEIGVRR